jgi:three-Cys-motif partner protein
VDAFAGAGQHYSRTTGNLVDGSPLVALNTEPPFKEYHYIELNSQKTNTLKKLIGERKNVYIYTEDCNEYLLQEILPKIRYDYYYRALILLDPYGLHLNWEVIKGAAETKSVDIFLNFPVADMNRNVFWQNPEGVDKQDIARMNAFWGDETWRDYAYETQYSFFGPVSKKSSNRNIAEGFRKRLKDIAGFANVPKPIPMKNSNRATVYYLFFASHANVANKIVEQIFEKYRY